MNFPLKSSQTHKVDTAKWPPLKGSIKSFHKIKILAVKRLRMQRRSFLQTHFQRAIIANSPDFHYTCSGAALFNAEDLIAAFANIIQFHFQAPSPVFIIFPGERLIYTFLLNYIRSWLKLCPLLPMFPRRRRHI